jgi:hypothetical protein
LTLPEVCESLLLPPDKFVREKHYVDFVNSYATSALGVDGLTCYRLRGGVVHRSNAAGHPYLSVNGNKIENVIFTVPETRFGMHGIQLVAGTQHPAITLILEQFLGQMDLAVQRWYEEHQHDEQVISRIWDMLAWRPDGMPGFIEGGPVLASGPEHPDCAPIINLRIPPKP